MFSMELKMYDDTPLETVGTLLTDITDQAEEDDARSAALIELQSSVEQHGKDGYNKLSVSLLSLMFKQLDIPTLGLESIGEDDSLNTSYLSGQIEAAIGGSEDDRVASMEGFLDVFRSFNSKAEKWIDEASDELAKLISDLPRGGKGSYQTAGTYSSLTAGNDRTATVVEYLVTGYSKDLQRCSTELAEQMRKVFSAHAKFDLAIRNMAKIKVPAPGDFKRTSGDVYLSEGHVGGNVLSITLNGKDSTESLSRIRSTPNIVEVTTEEVMAAARRTLTMLKGLQKFLKAREATEDAIDKAGNRRRLYLAVPALLSVIASSLGLAMPVLYGAVVGLSTTEIRRAFQLLLSDDNQKELIAELKTATDLIDESFDLAKASVAEIVKAAKSLKA